MIEAAELELVELLYRNRWINNALSVPCFFTRIEAVNVAKRCN